MRRHTKNRIIPAALLVVAALLAGCAPLPAFPAMPALAPDEVAALDLVPSAPAATPDAGPVSPDGFSPEQRKTVRIRNVGCTGMSTGTGFAIDDHTIVTNRHVIEGMALLQGSTHDGRDITFDHAVMATFADLAIITTREALPSAGELSDTNPQIGDRITVVGFPSGGQMTRTEGTILHKQADPLYVNLGEIIISDVFVEPGSSGSAVIDAEGRVVGVVYAKSENDLTFIVPITTLHKMLNDPGSFEELIPCR
jgi:S1-C subfamily serine protease